MGLMASAEREPITGVLGGAPAGFWGRTEVQGVRGEAPWSWKHFSFVEVQIAQIYPLFVVIL